MSFAMLQSAKALNELLVRFLKCVLVNVKMLLE